MGFLGLMQYLPIVGSIVGKFWDPLTKIAKDIADARVALANATTEQERIKAEERVRRLEQQRGVLEAEAKENVKVNAYTRTFLAAPVGFFLWKVLIYDKALGQWTGGKTDPLSPELWLIVGGIVGFYFLNDLASKWRGQ